MPSRKYPPAEPDRCAMKAAMPTPNSPPTAWVTGCRRASRSAQMSTAAATAATMPAVSPPIALAMTKTTTGSPESIIPETPPDCSQMVGVALAAAPVASTLAPAVGDRVRRTERIGRGSHIGRAGVVMPVSARPTVRHAINAGRNS